MKPIHNWQLVTFATPVFVLFCSTMQNILPLTLFNTGIEHGYIAPVFTNRFFSKQQTTWKITQCHMVWIIYKIIRRTL